MKSSLSIALAVALLALAPARARADDVVTVRVSGQASVLGDTDQAKTRALDDAFGSAVRQVSATLLPARLDLAARTSVEREIYQRARRFIASYRIEQRDDAADGLRLQISARVDTAKIRAVLESLGIGPDTARDVPVSRGGPRPRVVVMIGLAGAEEGIVPGPLRAALEGAVRDGGFEVTALSGATADEPVSDEDAIAQARRSGAGGVVVVTVSARGDGLVRGTPMVGATGSAGVRILDVRDGHEVALAQALAAGYGSSAADAAGRAVVDAARRALGATAERTSEYWPVAAPVASGLPVTITGVRTHRSLAALERQLAASRVDAHLVRRRLRFGLVEWVVEGSVTPQQLAAVLRSTAVPNGSVAARPVGRGVEVRVHETGGAS